MNVLFSTHHTCLISLDRRRQKYAAGWSGCFIVLFICCVCECLEMNEWESFLYSSSRVRYLQFLLMQSLNVCSEVILDMKVLISSNLTFAFVSYSRYQVDAKLGNLAIKCLVCKVSMAKLEGKKGSEDYCNNFPQQ